MLFVARASPIPWSDTISPKGMLFFSPYRYRGQLYSIIYGQATPSVIGQKSMALTLYYFLKQNDRFHFQTSIENIISIQRYCSRKIFNLFFILHKLIINHLYCTPVYRTRFIIQWILIHHFSISIVKIR